MSSEISISLTEALDLLNKWMEENRTIHTALNCGPGPVTTRTVGRLDSVTADALYLSGTKSTYPFGKHNLVQFPLSGCRFEYSDAEHAPEPLRSSLIGYDALLYIYYDNSDDLRSTLALAVFPLDASTQI
jgi:hypothetical protein